MLLNDEILHKQIFIINQRVFYAAVNIFCGEDSKEQVQCKYTAAFKKQCKLFNLWTLTTTQGHSLGVSQTPACPLAPSIPFPSLTSRGKKQYTRVATCQIDHSSSLAMERLIEDPSSCLLQLGYVVVTLYRSVVHSPIPK